MFPYLEAAHKSSKTLNDSGTDSKAASSSVKIVFLKANVCFMAPDMISRAKLPTSSKFVLVKLGVRKGFVNLAVDTIFPSSLISILDKSNREFNSLSIEYLDEIRRPLHLISVWHVS